MRWATYRTPSTAPTDLASLERALAGDAPAVDPRAAQWLDDGEPHPDERVGLVVEDQIYGLPAPRTLLNLLRGGADAMADAAREATDHPAEVVPVAEVTLCAPVPRPPSIRDFMAFEQHVATSMGALGKSVSPVWYAQPVFYFTNPAAVFGPYDAVPMAPGCRAFDYEVEVAAIIGQGGCDLSPAQAEESIAGYTIFVDWSARDLQSAEMKVGLGPAKAKDTATSMGPYLVTPDELEPFRTTRGFDLGMTATVNGVEYSSGMWSALYWTFPQMIAYASRGTRIRPGDVIGSGTVGTGCILELSGIHGGDEYPWLEPGDEVRVEVDSLGAIDAEIVPGPKVVPLDR